MRPRRLTRLQLRSQRQIACVRRFWTSPRVWLDTKKKQIAPYGAPKRTASVAQDSQNTDSLFDFLYLNQSRISSWLAQMVAEGVPLSAKYGATTTKTNGLSLKGSAAGFVSGEKSGTHGVSDAQEIQYSAQWSVPLTLLDMLSHNGFINRNIENASAGSLVLLSGRIQLFDIEFIQNGWKAITDFFLAQVKVTHANKGAQDAQRKHFTAIGEIVRVMPRVPQIYLHTPTGMKAWAILKQEHSTIDLSTLTLAYGNNIQGDWHMVAVLDAKPDDHVDTCPAPPFMGGDLAKAISEIQGPLREIVGRSSDAYAVSPIVIFRSIPKAA